MENVPVIIQVRIRNVHAVTTEKMINVIVGFI